MSGPRCRHATARAFQYFEAARGCIIQLGTARPLGATEQKATGQWVVECVHCEAKWRGSDHATKCPMWARRAITLAGQHWRKVKS